MTVKLGRVEKRGRGSPTLLHVRQYETACSQRVTSQVNNAARRSPGLSNQTGKGGCTAIDQALLLLSQLAAQGEHINEKGSRTPEVVQYRRHCASDYEQAQGVVDRFQK